jgi:VanZ family protein
MLNSRRGFGFWISAWWPVLASTTAVVIESTEYFGSNHTSGPFRWLFQHIFGTVSDAQWEVVHHLIRKSGHFIGYGIVGLTWLRAWYKSLPAARFFNQAALAMLGTALVASWDEWHQSFLPNRGSSIWDVVLDCCGAFVMMSIAIVAMKRFRTAPSTPQT